MLHFHKLVLSVHITGKKHEKHETRRVTGTYEHVEDNYMPFAKIIAALLRCEKARLRNCFYGAISWSTVDTYNADLDNRKTSLTLVISIEENHDRVSVATATFGVLFVSVKSALIRTPNRALRTPRSLVTFTIMSPTIPFLHQQLKSFLL